MLRGANTVMVYLTLVRTPADSISKSLYAVLYVLLVAVAESSPRGKQKNVLVFGGNGFLGAETVAGILGHGAEHTITLVSRGHWYWDSSVRIQPYVKHLKCDRMQTLRNCAPFVEYMQSVHDLYFDAVIDFSGYHPVSISDTLYLLSGRVRLYVYISTDSVYEVCNRIPVRDMGLLESDANRPEATDEQERLNAREDYGHRKLQCEEEIIKAHRDDAPDYVILRLPDVMGPRDTTHRWWIYQLWIRLHKHLALPLSVPSGLLDRPISLVFVEDVASLIVSMVISDQDDYINEIYNLAFFETPTLKEVLELTARKLNVTDLFIGPSEAEDAIYLYPSVTRGPINTQKAEDRLGWMPVRLDFAITKTVNFYEEAIKNPYFSRERNTVVNMLQSSLTNNPEGDVVKRAILKEYGIDLGIRKDEL